MNKVLLLLAVALLAMGSWTQRAALHPLKDLVQGMLLGTGKPKGEAVAASAQDTKPIQPGEGDPGSAYFLRESIHFTNAAGVRVIHAGVEVRKIGEDLSKGVVTVDDGLGQFPVSFAKLTRDPGIAAVLRGSGHPANTAAK